MKNTVLCNFLYMYYGENRELTTNNGSGNKLFILPWFCDDSFFIGKYSTFKKSDAITIQARVLFCERLSCFIQGIFCRYNRKCWATQLIYIYITLFRSQRQYNKQKREKKTNKCR